MVFFPNEKLEFWDYAESTTDFNAYYEPKKVYSLTATVPCDFQILSTSEQLKEFGELMNDTYKIYLPKETSIPEGVILRLKGKPDTYEVVGSPINNNHLSLVSHMKLIVRKQRKPFKLGESND